MHRALLVLVLMGGCVLQTSALVRGDRDGVAGGGISTESVLSRLRLGIEAGYERVTDDDDDEPRGVFGFDYTARVGLVTTVLDRAMPPWIDLGPAVGAGIATPADGAKLLAHAWVGAWIDARLWSSTAYPVLRIELQRDAYSSELRGATQLCIGVGFVAQPETRW